MPHSHTNYIDDPQWAFCPRKAESRRQTIISIYQTHFHHSLPSQRQYWTMCGKYSPDAPNCGEIFQMLQSGLITEQQFHGVDIEPSIITANQQLYPYLNWHHGDFLETMQEAAILGQFNPGIINYDGVRQDRIGVEYLRRIMLFIDSNCSEELLLSANIVLRNPYHRSDVTLDGRSIMQKLFSCYLKPAHWLVLPEYYTYYGTGKRSRTTMGTFIFLKKEHSKLEFV